MQKSFENYERECYRVKRKDRDRPGGHWCNPSVSKWKRKDRRKLRQEQRRIVTEALKDWVDFPESGFWIIGGEWYSWHEGDDNWDGLREEYPDQYEEFDEPPYSYDWLGYDWDYDCEPESEYVTIPRAEYEELRACVRREERRNWF